MNNQHGQPSQSDPTTRHKPEFDHFMELGSKVIHVPKEALNERLLAEVKLKQDGTPKQKPGRKAGTAKTARQLPVSGRSLCSDFALDDVLGP